MEKQTVAATLFIPPRGQRREIEVSKVLPDDAEYNKEDKMTTRYEYANGRQIQIVKLAFGNTTQDDPYYAKVDGDYIGVNGRTHWESEVAARLAAETYINGGSSAA